MSHYDALPFFICKTDVAAAPIGINKAFCWVKAANLLLFIFEWASCWQIAIFRWAPRCKQANALTRLLLIHESRHLGVVNIPDLHVTIDQNWVISCLSAGVPQLLLLQSAATPQSGLCQVARKTSQQRSRNIGSVSVVDHIFQHRLTMPTRPGSRAKNVLFLVD